MHQEWLEVMYRRYRSSELLAAKQFITNFNFFKFLQFLGRIRGCKGLWPTLIFKSFQILKSTWFSRLFKSSCYIQFIPIHTQSLSKLPAKQNKLIKQINFMSKGRLNIFYQFAYILYKNAT